MMRRGLSMLGGWDPSWMRIILTPALSWDFAGEYFIKHTGKINQHEHVTQFILVLIPINYSQYLYNRSNFQFYKRCRVILTCSCLMVSPPLPMMRPALPAGMIISCMEPDCPLGVSWPLETMSSMRAFALLEKDEKKKKKRVRKLKEWAIYQRNSWPVLWGTLKWYITKIKYKLSCTSACFWMWGEWVLWLSKLFRPRKFIQGFFCHLKID